MSERAGSIVIESVQPSVDDGRHAVKRVVGDVVNVTADLYKEGHDVLAAVVRFRQIAPESQATPWQEAPLLHEVNDRWAGSFPVARPGRYVFTVEAWTDWYASWAGELSRKVKAGQNVQSELLEGAAQL
ncbi:MAG TPA: maltotransferase domain-containing protein, partial [Gemmatimonadaceae bacterium]|nr:maltotransferase domain-containing protein [Gemmatimonadaceae bacterium]